MYSEQCTILNIQKLALQMFYEAENVFTHLLDLKITHNVFWSETQETI